MTNEEFTDQIIRAMREYATCIGVSVLYIGVSGVSVKFERKASKYRSFIRRFIAKHRISDCEFEKEIGNVAN